MKKEIKHMLFDPQVPNATLAKREQMLLAVAVLFLLVVAFALHAQAA